MSSYVFSSIILRKLLEEIEQLGEGIGLSNEKWAGTMMTKYRRELQEQPVVYLTDAENYQIRDYLYWYKECGLNLADRATQYIRGNHATETRKFLKSKHDGWPVMDDHERVAETHYPLPSDGEPPTSFKEWFAVTLVWRLTLAMTELSYQDAAIGTSQSIIRGLPIAWEQKLDECMQITDASAVVPAPKNWSFPLKRRDINSILPMSYNDANPSGLVNDAIMKSWFQILLSHRKECKLGDTVNIFPDSLDIAGSTPREVAEKAVLVNADIEMMLFPTVIKEQDHSILVVVYPKRKAVAVYNSLGHDSTKTLTKNRPWLKERYRPMGEDPWETIWIECPHQGEEMACGVFMLINALFAALIKDPANGYSAEDTLFLRRYIAAVICMGKLPEKVWTAKGAERR